MSIFPHYFVNNYCHCEVKMLIADVLVPTRHQDISNHHVDTGQSVHRSGPCNDIIDHDLTWNAQRTFSQEIQIWTCYHMTTPYMYDLGHEFIPGQVVDDHISSHKKPKICTRNINEPIEIITVWWGHDTLSLIAPGNKSQKGFCGPFY